jgi:hypothetical protein
MCRGAVRDPPAFGGDCNRAGLEPAPTKRNCLQQALSLLQLDSLPFMR